jgi:hypothetical protein
MGVYVKRSTIPNAGCGLFTSRPLRKGDVIGPYTGDVFGGRADLMNHRAGIMPMYSMEGSATMNVDASCRRGYGGYANEPVRGQTQPRLFVNIADSGIRSLVPSNVQWGQFTIQPAQVHRMFGPPDPVTGMRNVLPGGSNRFYTKGWRRISNELLQRVQGHTLPWLWARDNIPQGRGSVEHKKEQ